MSSREQKNEFWRLRKDIKSEYQPVCGNCGSIENIEFHHVVPLEFGGRNVITNIVPLCHQCHCLAHQKVGKKSVERAGRPRKDAPEGYKEAIDRYIRGELKGKDFKREMGMDRGTRICEKWFYKEYLDECGIEKVEKRGSRDKVRSYVYYKDGRVEKYIKGQLSDELG